MSQMLNNRPDESGNNSEQCSGENRGQTRPQGFEGMNYEQRRPSYPHQPMTNKGNERGDRKGKSPDEI